MVSTLKPFVAALALVASAAGRTVSTKKFTMTDGTTYTYDLAPPSTNGSLPTVLFVHGFPSTRHDWGYQMQVLTDAGFGVIAPDTLGSGGTDKPLELSLYRAKRQADHLAELLTHEDLDQVIGVGHDWGSYLLSRVYVYHPDRFQKLAFLSVGYAPPGFNVDIDANNAQSLKKFGYTQSGYWYFFFAHDAPALITQHLESFYHAVYAANTTDVASSIAHLGALRAWLQNDNKTSLAHWDTQEHKDAWMSAFSLPNATEASLAPYRRVLAGTDVEDEAEMEFEDISIKVPVLLIGSPEDRLSPGPDMAGQTEPFALEGVEEHQLSGGHWIMMEHAEEVAEILKDFATPTRSCSTDH